MHSEEPLGPGDLVRRAAEACSAGLAALADSYVAELAALTGYSESDIPRDELYRTAVRALQNMLAILSGSQDTGVLQVVSENIGRRRARQGVPLDSLLRAVRLDFPFLWRAMRAQIPADAQNTFADEVVTVWDTVETHVSNVQAGYIAELAEMNRELEIEQTYLIRRLLVAGVDDPGLRTQAAAQLGLRLTDKYLVAAASPNHRQEFRPAVRTVDPRIRVHALDGEEFVLFDDSILTATHRHLLAAAPMGVAPVAVQMEELPVMWKLATRLAKLVTGTERAATFEEMWPLLPHGQFAEELRITASAQLDELFSQPGSDPEYLLQTALSIMATGNVSRTAEDLFCHRNTILNRLRRFTALTGLDPTLPNDAGLVRLLLAARAQPR